ncbi:MAG: fliJ [Clostridia bacterium]|jgi:flagellar FliJ protein|nr:fliJ [Clostridia bacterium]
MFKFELNSVLSLKEKIEDVKKRELGIANTYKEELELQKEALVNEHDGIYVDIKKSSCAEVDIHAIKVLSRYSSYINKQIKDAEVHIVKAQKVVDIKREELLQAMKERKILDNLKEIKLEQHMEESKRLEQVLIDEIISYKYGQEGRENS